MSLPTGNNRADLSPRGLRNNNPGNLAFIEDPKHAWNGQCGQDGALAIYDTLINGIRAAGKELLLSFKRQHNTVELLIGGAPPDNYDAWAPPNENDTEAYIEAVCRQTAFAKNGVLTPDADTLFALLKAIFRVELGGHFVADDTIRHGVEAALST